MSSRTPRRWVAAGALAVLAVLAVTGCSGGIGSMSADSSADSSGRARGRRRARIRGRLRRHGEAADGSQPHGGAHRVGDQDRRDRGDRH
jgi:hypothetical protein